MSTLRARLLDAAARLYREGGLTAVSTDALAREAGTSKRAIYTHFKGRDDVLDALLSARFDQLGADLGEIEALDAPVRRKLRLFAERVALVPREFPAGFWGELLRAAPEVAARARARREEVGISALARLLAQGAASGEVRADIPVPVLARIASVMAEATLLVEPPAGASPLAVADAALAVLLDGVLAHDGARA